MKAEIFKGKGSGQKRAVLKDIVPLEMPFCIDIFPIYACNFKCKYCLYSLNKREHGYNFSTNIMSLDLFKKCVDDMKQFPNKLKMLRFVGIGEPLLNPDISEMVKYAKLSDVSEQIEIVTNGSLLTKEMSDKLINSQLPKLYISIQGLTKEKYLEISQYNLDMNEFRNSIKYFYDNKKETELRIKILDCGLNSKKDELIFYKMFGDICDYITIEATSPLVSKVDYTRMGNFNKTVRGNIAEEFDICSFPFYMMQINPDGSIYPCCSAENMKPLGDCTKDHIFEIWKGINFVNFQKKMLTGAKNCDQPCAKCLAFRYSSFPEDRISKEDAEQILEKMIELQGIKP